MNMHAVHIVYAQLRKIFARLGAEFHSHKRNKSNLSVGYDEKIYAPIVLLRFFLLLLLKALPNDYGFRMEVLTAHKCYQFVYFFKSVIDKRFG